MHALALLCLVVAAAAKPQGTADDSVTTVTERSYTIRAEADKYYGNNAGYAYPYAAYPYSNPSAYSAYYSGVSPARTYQTYFQQAPAYQTYHHQAPAYQAYQTYQTYHHHAPAYQAYHAPTYHAVTAAPHTAVSYAAPAVSYETATAAPAVSYHTATAVPAVAYHTATAAPAVAYHTATAAPAVAYHTATAAPAVSYHAATAAPAVSYHTATAAPAVAYHQTANVAPVAVHSVAAPVVTVRNDYGNEAKVFKHVYAFAAPEEPATRALVHVEAPVNKRKHYKLVFIKAPTHETVVDSDITLPAQEEEKTLIYVLSKNQKQAQPEVRIKQSEASKHAKPEVFFLKYKNEAEAQAIASGAISGQTANVPAEGEIISDGSVSVLGQSSGAAFSSDALNANYGSTFESGAYDHSLRTGFSSQPALVYRAGISNLPARISTVSTGAVGIVPVTQSSIVAAAPVATVTPVTVVGDAASFGGFSGGFAFGRSADNEEPVNVGVKVNAEPSDAVETSTVSTHSF